MSSLQSPDPIAPAPVATPVPRLRPGPDWRVFGFFSTAIALTGIVSLLFADLLWRTGWSGSSTILLVLFVLLFLPISVGCLHGVWGFVLRVWGDRHRITGSGEYHARSIAGASTAIVFPIYNEQIARVYEGLRTTFLSLAQTGQLEQFDFFILSDSTNPDIWIEEERRWFELTGDLDALGRIYYRRRELNEGKKSGNIRDFLNTWGRRYRYFIVFDADSVMRGQTLVDLVKLMESHPDVGLIQTVPALVNAESMFGRIQQFANRLYGAIFITGLNFWAQNLGNYWGHNAIIRTEPFMQGCDLPHLPGAKPFGGHILSHDFVEAALLVKENWQAWFAYDLEGSYEEAPQGMIENARRDRRWCQGNLQHAMLLFAKGLRGVSRIHLLMGIFGYLCSPLWLLFLLTFNGALWFRNHTGLSQITVRARTPFLKLSGTEHALLIFIICMVMLFLPKILALLELAWNPRRRRAFGGLGHAATSAVAETIFSALHAPLQMLWHSKFVATILLGIDIHWGPQQRDARGLAWLEGVRQHWGHTVVGVVWGTLVWWLDSATFWWFAPVVAGMVLSIPLSVLTSRTSWGIAARHASLFLTPEETSPPLELAGLNARMELLDQRRQSEAPSQNLGVAAAVLDPYVNAIHVSLLREKYLHPEAHETLARLGQGKPAVRTLAEKWLTEGNEALKSDDKLLVLSDPDAMSWLHRQCWLRPSTALAPFWQSAVTS